MRQRKHQCSNFNNQSLAGTATFAEQNRWIPSIQVRQFFLFRTDSSTTADMASTGWWKGCLVSDKMQVTSNIHFFHEYLTIFTGSCGAKRWRSLFGTWSRGITSLVSRKHVKALMALFWHYFRPKSSRDSICEDAKKSRDIGRSPFFQ